MAHREETSPVIALSGIGPKVDFAEKLYDSLTWENKLKILPPLEVLIQEKGLSLGDKISGEQFWSLENICIEFEQKYKENPKLICTTPLDRFALAEYSGLKMGTYFNRIIPSFVNDCDVFCFRPIESKTDDRLIQMDEQERCFLMTRNVNAQVLVGSDDQQLKTVQECLKLRFMGVVKNV